MEHAVWLAARIAAPERVCLEDCRPRVLCGETWSILSAITSSKSQSLICILCASVGHRIVSSNLILEFLEDIGLVSIVIQEIHHASLANAL